MEIWISFCHREWWLRRHVWLFADKIYRDSKTFLESFVQCPYSTSEIMTVVILTTESHG